MQKRNRKNRVITGYLAGCLSGCLAACWMSQELIDTFENYRMLMSARLTEIHFYQRDFLYYLFRIRVWECLILFGSIWIGKYRKILTYIVITAGIWSGMLIVILLQMYSLSGIGYLIGILLPQYLFYGFGCLLLYEFERKKTYFTHTEGIMILLQIAVVFAFGILSEYGIEPFFFQQFLNKFGWLRSAGG